MTRAELKMKIRDVRGFPRADTFFRDIGPLLRDPVALETATHLMAAPFQEAGITVVAALESRGFILGPLVGQALGCGVVMVRRPGRLPPKVDKVRLGENRELEVQLDLIKQGDRVLICDDLLASGQTAEAAVALFERNGVEVVGLSFLIELIDKRGRERLGMRRVENVFEA